MTMKKIITISVLVIVVALSIWLIFFRTGSVSIPESLGGSPFGSGEDISIPAGDFGEDTTGQETSFDQTTPEAKIFRIANTPVAGFVVLTKGADSVVRYVDRATGHIFDFPLPKAGQGGAEKVRVTNNTLPKIYEAYFRSDGNAVLLRSLDNDSDVINNISLALTAPRATTTGELYGVSSSNLRGDIDSLVAGTGDTLFYVLKDARAIVSSSFTGASQKTIFSSNFDNWRLSRAGSNLLIYTKSKTGVSGYAYTLNTVSGALTKVAGPQDALTATANSLGTRLIYSYLDSGQTKSVTKNLQNNSTLEILPSTLAEKCIWSTKQTDVVYCGVPAIAMGKNEPDGWYQGRTFFSDKLWSFDTKSEIAQVVSEPKAEFDLDLDISEPKLSPSEDYLVFVNKRDLTLWAIKLVLQ